MVHFCLNQEGYLLICRIVRYLLFSSKVTVKCSQNVTRLADKILVAPNGIEQFPHLIKRAKIILSKASKRCRRIII